MRCTTAIFCHSLLKSFGGKDKSNAVVCLLGALEGAVIGFRVVQDVKRFFQLGITAQCRFNPAILVIIARGNFFINQLGYFILKFYQVFLLSCIISPCSLLKSSWIAVQ